jgi:hypothetical protein
MHAVDPGTLPGATCHTHRTVLCTPPCAGSLLQITHSIELLNTFKSSIHVAFSGL